MKTPTTLAAALAALLLAGCSITIHHPPGHGMHGGGHAGGMHGGMHSGMHGGPRMAADPANPRVLVMGGQVRVDQEVLRFTTPRQEVLITWRLPADGPYRFAPDGVRFEARADGEIVRCGLGAKPTEFSCLNRNTRREFYKYDVRVLDGDKPLPPLDPFVANDW